MKKLIASLCLTIAVLLVCMRENFGPARYLGVEIHLGFVSQQEVGAKKMRCV